MNTLTYLSSDAFSSIPSDLVPDLQRMLSSNESFRPTAMDFTGKYSFVKTIHFLHSLNEKKTVLAQNNLGEFHSNKILVGIKY
jgi:hypothetical protein